MNHKATHVDVLVRKRTEHLKRLVLVPRLQTLRVEPSRDNGFDQRIEECDERAGKRRNEGTVIPIWTLARKFVARIETLRPAKKNAKIKNKIKILS